jgi:hypothetical protein
VRNERGGEKGEGWRERCRVVRKEKDGEKGEGWWKRQGVVRMGNGKREGRRCMLYKERSITTYCQYVDPVSVFMSMNIAPVNCDSRNSIFHLKTELRGDYIYCARHSECMRLVRVMGRETLNCRDYVLLCFVIILGVYVIYHPT